MFRAYNKRKQATLTVQKPSKKKFVHQKEIEELVSSTKIIPSKTRSGRSPQKVAFVYVISGAPKRKKRLRKFVELEEEEDASISLTKKRKTIDGLEFSKVQDPEVMDGLKSFVFKDPNASKEVVSKAMDTLEALNAGGACINLNLLSEDVFDYFTLNRKSPTPSPIPSSGHSLIQPSSPIVEPMGNQNQLALQTMSDQ